MSIKKAALIVLFSCIGCTGTSSRPPAQKQADKDAYPLIEQKVSAPTQLGKTNLDGMVFKGLLAAYESFQADEGIPSSKRNIENYSIAIEEGSMHYYFFFEPKRTQKDAEIGAKGSFSELGISTVYEVDKKSLRVTRKAFTK